MVGVVVVAVVVDVVTQCSYSSSHLYYSCSM